MWDLVRSVVLVTLLGIVAIHCWIEKSRLEEQELYSPPEFFYQHFTTDEDGYIYPKEPPGVTQAPCTAPSTRPAAARY